MNRSCVPGRPVPPPFDGGAVHEAMLRDVGAIILATGFHPTYRSWIDAPDAFDAVGHPLHTSGESTVVPGLYFVGVHFLRKRRSALLMGVGEDATLVAGAVAEHVAGAVAEHVAGAVAEHVAGAVAEHVG